MELSLVALYTLLISMPLGAVILYITWKINSYSCKESQLFIALSKKFIVLFSILSSIYIIVLFSKINVKAMTLVVILASMIALMPLFRAHEEKRSVSNSIKVIFLVTLTLTFYRLFLTYVPLIFPDSWRDVLEPSYVSELRPFYPTAYLPIFLKTTTLLLSTNIYGDMLLMSGISMILLYLITELVNKYLLISSPRGFHPLYMFTIMMSITWFYSPLLGIASFSVGFIMGMLMVCIALRAGATSVFSDKRKILLLLVLGIPTLFYHVLCYLLAVLLIITVEFFKNRRDLQNLFKHSVILFLPYFVYTTYTTARHIYFSGRLSFEELINILTNGIQPRRYAPPGGDPLTTAIFSYLPIVTLFVVSFSSYLFSRKKEVNAGISLYSSLLLLTSLASSQIVPAIGLGRYLGVLGIFWGSIILGKFIFKCACLLRNIGLITLVLFSVLYSGSLVFTLGTNFKLVYENDISIGFLNVRQTRDMAIALTYNDVNILDNIAPLMNRANVYGDFFTGYTILHNVLSYSETCKIHLIQYENIPLDVYELSCTKYRGEITRELALFFIRQDLEKTDISYKMSTSNVSQYSENYVFIRPELSYFKNFYGATIQSVNATNRLFDASILQIFEYIS
jgi:hypothetical protein